MSSELDKAMAEVAGMVESHGIDQRGGKKYVQVVHRVGALRKAFGITACIETAILQDDGERVLMRAVVKIAGEIIGIGHAEEIRGEGYVNKTSAVENCETSAIGRALAACGLAGGEYASVNELDGVQRKEQAQASKEKPSKSPPATDKPFTKEQKAERYEAILNWLHSGKANEKQISGMLPRSAELVDEGKLTQRDQRKIFTECLILLGEWDDARAHLVRMANNSYLTKKQIEDYMERVDAGRAGK